MRIGYKIAATVQVCVLELYWSHLHIKWNGSYYGIEASGMG